MHGLGDVQRDRRTDQREQHERRHRQPERRERPVGHLDRGALVDRRGDLAEEPGEQPVHHERRASVTSTQDFFSSLPTANAVASVASFVRSARTISSSGSTATGLKKWKPTTRSGRSSSAAISVIDSDEVLVARIASALTHRLELGEHLLLDREVLEDRLDDEVGVGEGVLGQRAGDQRLEPVGLVRADPALGQQLVELPWT